MTDVDTKPKEDLLICHACERRIEPMEPTDEIHGLVIHVDCWETVSPENAVSEED